VTTADLAAVTGMLARMHAVRAESAEAPVRALELPDRAVIETSLRERAEPWRTGPYGEPARALVNEHAASLATALDAFDVLTAELSVAGGELVITHGEPHVRNLMRSDNGLLLIDWDSAGLALPERDLWWIVSDSGAEAALYAQLIGRAVSEKALSFYRLRWDLPDLAEFLPWFRAPHERSADAETAWRGLADIVGRLAGRYPG
jgi:spectinomycin phosphotransferase